MRPALIEPLETRIAPAAVVGISGSTQISEGPDGTSMTLTFTVSLSEPVDGDVTVDCLPMDGTALRSSDYEFASQAVTIFTGALSQEVSVTVYGDASFETDETFSLRIQNVFGDAIIGEDTATVTILNDDGPPTVGILNASHPEGNTDTPFGFTVQLSEVSGVDVSVQIATSTNGSADDGDFDQIDQEFIIPAGQLEATFYVNVKGDTFAEGDEVFLVTMTNAQNATFGIAQANGNIEEDDNTVFTIDDTTVTEGINPKAFFEIKLSQAQAFPVTIKYRTANGSAVAGSDYVAAPLTEITFAAGEIEKTIEISLIDDAISESSETFRVILSEATVGTIMDGEATATIGDNDPTPVLTIGGPENQTGTVFLDEGNSLRGNVFTLTLDRASNAPISVNLRTIAGTAVSGVDFTALDRDITFAAGETTKTITLSVLGDTVDELDETLQLEVAGISGNVVLPASPTNVVLRNDELLLTVADAQVVEGNSGTKQMVFTVTLSQPWAHAVSVGYKTSNGTAGSADFTPVDVEQTLTFAPGETSKIIEVTIVGDGVGEADEFFTLDFPTVTDATINQTSVRGTIIDDDPFLSISDAQVFEGGPNTSRTMVFTVSLLRAPAFTTVTMDYATASAASNPAIGGPAGTFVDFVNANGSLTFAPGETTKTISVTVNGDGVSEADENFTVTLGNVNGIAPAGQSDLTGVGKIIDDEGLVFASDVSIVESDAGTTNMVFVLNLVRAAGNNAAVKVDYATEDGTAISAGTLADYTAAMGSVTFAAGQTQKTISVPIRGDLLREGDQAFKLNLSVDNTGVAASDQASVATPSVTGTIIDNDPLPIFTVSGGSVVEGANGAAIVFTVNLAGGSQAPVTVNVATQGGTATSGVDFTALTTQLVFTPGQTSATISVPVTNDSLLEGDETFKLVLSDTVGATIGSAEATGTIRDDEIVVTLDPGDFAGPVSEGSNGATLKQMKVKLSQAPLAGQSVVVNFSVTGITATAGSDFVLLNPTNVLTFNAGETEKTIDFNILGDALDEVANEDFTVSLNPQATNAVVDGTQATRTAIIVDDDAPPTITIDDAQVTEGNAGTTTMDFTIRLNAPSAQTVTVFAGTLAGTALAGSDFTTRSDTITFAPGETVKTFSVTINGDTNDEANETLTVKLSAPANAILGDDTALGTIFDNDARSLSIADATAAEGNSGTTTITFKVRLSSAATQVVTVDYFTANGTAVAGQDYVENIGTLTFSPGLIEKDVVITLNGDTTAELDETFFVRLQSNPNAPVNALLVDGEAVGTIQQDETQFTFDTTTPISGAEEPVMPPGGGDPVAKTFNFRIKRTGDLTQAGSATYTTVDGTAVAGKDFIAQNGTVSFAAGENEKTVAITLVNDLSFEADETFSLRLTGSANGIIVNSVGTPSATFDQTATIVGSDTRPTVEISDASMVEGNHLNTMTFTVKLRAGGQDAANETENVVVQYHTVAGTARDSGSGLLGPDFNPIFTGSLLFAKGETSKTFVVQIIGDSADENDETFSVVIDSARTMPPGSSTPIDLVIGDGTGVGTIIDNDAAPVIVFSSNTTVNEGSFGNSTVKPRLELRPFSQLSGGPPIYSEKDITVIVTTVPGTATPGADFLGPATQTITIPAGSSFVDLDYAILGDTIREGNETFTLVLSDPQNAGIATPSATVTITNDDAVPQLAINSVALVEGDNGTSNMIFTVSLQGATDQAVTVNFGTIDGTAKSGGGLPDYVATSGSLSFAPGETTKTIIVPIHGDTWAELDENFTVTLSSATNATILNATGTGTIQNGGDTVVGLVVNDAVSLEDQFELNPDGSLALINGDPIRVFNAKLLFLVELTKPLESNLTFSAQTRNGTAISNGPDADYTPLNDTFTIFAGNTSVNVPVSIKDDGVFEATENFFLGIGNTSDSSVLEARGEGRGVLLNDDLIFVDAKTLRYVDADGDLATIQISKGSLQAATMFFSIINPQTGGRSLEMIDFANSSNPAQFKGANLRITAEPQTGFDATGLTTDGGVDVGFIRASIPDTTTLEVLRGVDLGSILVQGDVGKIVVGDRTRGTPSIIGKVSVQSLGARGAETLPASEVIRDSLGNLVSFNNVSVFIGTLNALEVSGDVEGVVQALGSINSLRIDGALRGDPTPVNSSINSGVVFFTGTLGKATVGEIIGGANSDSGVINGNTNYTGKIGSLHVLGDIVGGTGSRSGRVVAKAIGSVVVDGDVIGGGSTGFDGDGFTPKGSDSGEILATSSLTSVKIGGNVKGGIQRNTGIISSGGSVTTLRIGGSLIGGTGSFDSGAVIVNTTLSDAAIAGDIVGAAGERSGTVQVGGVIKQFTLGKNGGTGGNVRGGAGDDSGMIAAGAGFVDADSDGFRDDFVVSGGAISNALLYGDIVGGTGDGSGGVLAGGTIAKLDVRGDLIGGDAPVASGLVQSGFVLAGRLTLMTLGGDLCAGRNFGTGLADSGSIRVHENIGTLNILGDVVGNDTNRAIISAGNNGPKVNNVSAPAIAKLTIGQTALNGTVTGGNIAFLDVLAGYGEFGRTFDPRGAARNADAQIGTVNFKGNVQATNIVAGVDPGSDNVFGSADDHVLSGFDVVDNPRVISSIAKVIIGGNVLANDVEHGIVAQRVASITAANLVSGFGLIAGAGNDFFEIADGTKVYVNEV